MVSALDSGSNGPGSIPCRVIVYKIEINIFNIFRFCSGFLFWIFLVFFPFV